MADRNLPRAEVVVDLEALAHNVALLAGRAAASGAATMAVVKADGYGHGAVPVARAALGAGASWIGVASQAEALALRTAGIDAPVLSWLDTIDTDFAPGIAAGIDVSASSTRELGAIIEGARAAGATARVHLKIDTGLSRNGCPATEWPELVAAANAAPEVETVAVWSHLACADEPGHPSIDRQADRFARACAAVDGRPLRHLANSAATLTRPDLHLDLVRVGIAMYGLNPVAQPEDLRPVMSFRSSVVLTKRIAAGESVSYGQTWTAATDTNLALVPAGYADGVPRALSGRLHVWLAGRRRPVVGRVCMDQLVVDCGDDRVPVGEQVVLFGDGSAGEPTATEWADTLGTIDYEIVTGLYRPRVTRTYRGAE
ncbi:alanine racemase [Actinophytocola xinjiangensis]|uniref:Alanine racemase n=1 Tax=Actinophytocola xinjiangensis TaxID=485602 RepID=A0A7Z0WEA0_9PSEU|nr:alanine racemase [Actinophytocola xinjiangensis]OLF04945.1 alanine racemase [Actinophytocola xinjiangensis]